jgi:hypothetical protein
MNAFYLAALFCVLELLMSAIFYSGAGLAIHISEGGPLGLRAFASGILTVIFRIFSLQILLQVVLVYLSIRYYNGWPRLWPVLLAVLASMLLWSLIPSGIHLTFKPEPFRIAFMFGGIPILIGSISSWLILYKWLGLKPLIASR